MVYLGKGALTTDMPVIVRPTPDEGIELHDQMPGSALLVPFDDVSDFG